MLSRSARGTREREKKILTSVDNGSSQVSLGSLLHLEQDHGRNLLGGELLGLSLVFNLNDGLGVFVNNLERPVLHVGLNIVIGKLATDQTLGVKDGAAARKMRGQPGNYGVKTDSQWSSRGYGNRNDRGREVATHL